MTATTLLDRVRVARQAANVERCHLAPHLLRYSVGHHSLDVVTLVVLTWQAAHAGVLPRSNLLVAAAFHDIPEIVVGDINSNIKDLLGSNRLDRIERNLLAWLGVDVLLTDEEALWLRCCDRLELSLWAAEEANHRGNWSLEGWPLWSRNNDAPEVFQQFFDILMCPKARNRDLGPFSWQQLAEAAGL